MNAIAPLRRDFERLPPHKQEEVRDAIIAATASESGSWRANGGSVMPPAMEHGRG